jgi:hypothetical protein
MSYPFSYLPIVHSPLIPVNTGHGAFEHCFLDKFFWAAFRFDDNRFLGFLVKFENLWTYILATAAAYALIFIDNDSFFYFDSPPLFYNDHFGNTPLGSVP